MKKILLCTIPIIVLIFTISCSSNPDSSADKHLGENETSISDEKTEIVPIPLEDVKGISLQEAERLCCTVMGEKDEETGFLFSFGVSGAVQIGDRQYYTIRASWLVNNSHLSYIGDFFVAADGKEIYTGTVLPEQFSINEKIWAQ